MSNDDNDVDGDTNNMLPLFHLPHVADVLCRAALVGKDDLWHQGACENNSAGGPHRVEKLILREHHRCHGG